MESVVVSMKRMTAIIFSALLLVLGALPAPAAPLSTTLTGTISGSVLDRDGSIPISGATVELAQGTTIVATAQADKFGAFTFPPVPTGAYTIVVHAQGYGTVRSDSVLVGAGTLNLSLVMQRSQTAGAVRSIGRVVVSSRAAGLQTATTIQAVADPTLAQRTNAIRMAIEER